MKQILKSKIVKNSAWLVLLQIVNTIVPMMTIPFVTRKLGSDTYGIFSICLNWILYLQVLVEFGFGLTGARKAALIDNESELNKLFNNIISSRIVLFILSLLIYIVIAIVSNFTFTENVCFLIMFIMIFGTTFQLTWLFQGKQDMKFITIVNCISRFISTILIFVFIDSSSDLYLYAFFYTITILLSSIISMIIAKKKYHLTFKYASLKNIKTELIDAKDVFYSSAMSKIFSGFGITVLGFLETKSIVGIYSAISKIPYVMTMLFSPISQAIFPYVSIKMKKNKKDGVIFLKKVGVPVFLLFFVVGIVLLSFRNFIVELLFGAEYSCYSIIMFPLIFQFLFAIINNFMGVQFLVGTDNKKYYSNAFFKSCIISIIANIILGKLFGIYGVAIATLIGEIFLTFFLIINIIKVGRLECILDEEN